MWDFSRPAGVGIIWGSMWSWGSGVILPWRLTPGRKSYGSFLPNSASLFFWNRWRKTSERVHFFFAHGARSPRTWKVIVATRQERLRATIWERYLNREVRFIFRPKFCINRCILLRTLKSYISHFVIKSGEYFGSMIRRLFFLIFLFLRSSLWYVIFQIILCSFIHALCSITNLSE